MRAVKFIFLFIAILSLFAQWQIGLLWDRLDCQHGEWTSVFLMTAKDRVVIWHHGRVLKMEEWEVYQNDNRDSLTEIHIKQIKK